MSKVENSEKDNASCASKLDAIRQVYNAAYRETESFEVCPVLTAFLFYACGVIANSDGEVSSMEADREVLTWLEEHFDANHPFWNFVKVELFT